MENDDPEEQGSYQRPDTTLMMTWLPMIYRECYCGRPDEGGLRRLRRRRLPGRDAGAAIRPGNGSKLLYNALLGPKAGVPQTYDFFNGADKNAVIRSTLAKAMADLTTRYGSDTARWRTPVVKHTFLTTNFIGCAAGRGRRVADASELHEPRRAERPGDLQRRQRLDVHRAPPGQSGFVARDGRKLPHYVAFG